MERGGEKRFHCDHCGEKISRSLYFEHKRLFYSSVSNTWDKESLPVDKKEPIQDFSFSDNETSEGIVTS